MNLDFLSLYKIISELKTLFWKNSKIIYINSNKKNQNVNKIDELIPTKDRKWVICQSNTKFGYKFYKHHLFKMKKRLFDITRNLSETDQLVYSGFVSPMFAAYDGYVLGDNRNYIFIDTDSNSTDAYKIEYKKRFLKNYEFNEEQYEEINVFFSCSTDINMSEFKGKNFYFNKKSKNKVDTKYLQEVYSYTKSLLDYSNKNNVKRVNMYIAAKQPVSFIIGTAIRSGHPKVFIYEYSNGKYTLPLLIQDGKILKNECK